MNYKSNKKYFSDNKKTGRPIKIISFSVFLLATAITLFYGIQFIINHPSNISGIMFVIFNMVFSTLFWYPSIFMMFLVLLTFIKRNTLFDKDDEIVNTIKLDSSKRVALLYCTKDDFIERAFNTLMWQDYENADVFILDDSVSSKYRNMIDEVIKQHSGKVKLLRRNGIGWKNKAGNLNNFYDKHINEYDFFTIADSDSYFCKNVVTTSLKYFEYYGDVGIVQGITTLPVYNETRYMDLMTPNDKYVRKYWAADFAANSKYSFVLCCGHAYTISKESLKSVGLMPNILAEDSSIALLIRNKGFYTIIASNMYCYDQLPPNYPAFRKRSIRWQGGDFGVFKRYFFKTIFGNFTIHEKASVFVLLLMNSIAPFISIFSLIMTSIMFLLLPSGAGVVNLPWQSYILSNIFIATNVFCYAGKSKMGKSTVWETIKMYCFYTWTATAALPSMAVNSVLLMFGFKTKFIVSIKENEKISIWKALKINFFDIFLWFFIYGLQVASLTVTVQKSGYSVLLFLLNPMFWISFFGFLFIIPLTLVSNKKSSINSQNIPIEKVIKHLN